MTASGVLPLLHLLAPSLLVLGLAGLALAWGQRGRRRKSTLAMVGLMTAASAALLGGDPRTLVDRVSWRLWSHGYKQELAMQPAPGGGLPHLLWDAWGFGGDTFAYLVRDPSDNLLPPNRQSREGLVEGVPCPVSQVIRLKPGWFVVTTYTDSDWDHCAPR